MQALRDVAYAGGGVVQLPIMMIWEDLTAGRLVEVLQGWHPPAGIVVMISTTVLELAPIFFRAG